MQSDLSYLFPMYPILGAIACLLCFIPIPWHWKAGNIAVTALGLWILGMNIIFWVGTIAWHNTVDNPYPIWGDIVNYFMVMWPTATASTSLCIQYRLWQVTRARSVFISKKEKRRRIYTTLVLCLGLPILIMPIHYVVQPNRYYLFEDFGPVLATYDVVLAYPLFWIIDPIICLIETVFAVLTIRTLLTHRKEMDSAFSMGSSNVNKNHFVRLVCLTAIAVLLHLSLSLWVIISNSINNQVQPWVSWDYTHGYYSEITIINRSMMQQSQESVRSMSLMLFATTICAFNYFFLFGFGERAMQHYRSFIRAIVRPFGIKYPREEERTIVERTRQGSTMFGRLGKALGLPAPTPSMKHLDPNPSKIDRSGRSGSLFSQSTTVTKTGDDDLCIDMTNLDFQKGRTGHPSINSTKGRRAQELSRGRDSITEGSGPNLTDHKESEKPEATSEPSISNLGGDNDLEAQEPRRSEGQDVRRKAILEKNPELTEEVTF